jgi:cytochrome c-type biogenesis protein CcmH/NrfG
MRPIPAPLCACLFSALLGFIQPAPAEVYPLIVRGKVVMQDGSPPPKSVGIQRLCTDYVGSAPGPVTDRKGEYLWRMDVDPMRTRVCRMEASLAGYVSSAVDISGLDGSTKTVIELAPIVLTLQSPDPMTIETAENGVPGRAMSAWKAAVKAIQAGDLQTAQTQLQAVVEASGKFARGWQVLGIVDDTLLKYSEARDAYQHAIEADPKMLAPYATLSRVCLKAKDWPAAAKAADELIKIDTKHVYPEIYLHQAAARYELKDLDGAEASARQAIQEALRPDQKKKAYRAEFMLGRIFAAKGDYNAAREHVAKYLELDPNTPDVDLIKAYLQVVGKPEGAGVDPDLELP